MPWTTYNRILTRFPWTTRSAVAATFMGGGDAIAQTFFEPHQNHHDVARTARFAVYGFLFHAPCLAKYFGMVNKIQFQNKILNVSTKIALDATVWSTWSITMFYSAMGVMEGKNLEDIIDKVKAGFAPTYLRGVLVYVPVSAATYSIIAPAHRGLWLQAVGLGWNTYLSHQNLLSNQAVSEHHLQHQIQNIASTTRVSQRLQHQ